MQDAQRTRESFGPGSVTGCWYRGREMCFDEGQVAVREGGISVEAFTPSCEWIPDFPCLNPIPTARGGGRGYPRRPGFQDVYLPPLANSKDTGSGRRRIRYLSPQDYFPLPSSELLSEGVSFLGLGRPAPLGLGWRHCSVGQ
jgi:hypothetical protein